MAVRSSTSVSFHNGPQEKSSMDAVNELALVVDKTHQRVVLRAVLQAILFQRSLGPVQSHIEDVLGCQVATFADPEISTQVNTRVEAYWQRCAVKRRYEGELAIVFSQRKSRKSWFTSTEEEVPFELHKIRLSEPSGSPSASGADAARSELERALMAVVRFCAERTRQIPPISSGAAQVPFPYEILVDPPSPAQMFAARTPPQSPATAAPSQDVTPHRTYPATSASSSPRDDPRGPGRPGTTEQAPRRESGGAAAAPGPASAALGYLEQARGGLLAVGERVGGAVGQWSGKS